MINWNNIYNKKKNFPHIYSTIDSEILELNKLIEE